MNVSNGTNFKNMFVNCASLSDIKPLEKWNISFENIIEKEKMKK